MQQYALNTASLVALLITFVLPLVVGLVTKSSTAASTKAILLLALTALTNVLTQFAGAAEDAGFPWGTTLVTAAVGFAMAVAVHFGLWKPTGATITVQAALVKDTVL